MKFLEVLKFNNIKVPVDRPNQTVWLSRPQIAKMFGVSIRSVERHIQNIFKAGELHPENCVYTFSKDDARQTASGKEGLKHYNLDMIIEIGNRVRGPVGESFRAWTRSVLTGALIEKLIGPTLPPTPKRKKPLIFPNPTAPSDYADSLTMEQILKFALESGFLIYTPEGLVKVTMSLRGER